MLKTNCGWEIIGYGCVSTTHRTYATHLLFQVMNAKSVGGKLQRCVKACLVLYRVDFNNALCLQCSHIEGSRWKKCMTSIIKLFLHNFLRNFDKISIQYSAPYIVAFQVCTDAQRNASESINKSDLIFRTNTLKSGDYNSIGHTTKLLNIYVKDFALSYA